MLKDNVAYRGMMTQPYNILYFSSFGSMKGGGQRSLYYLVRGLNKEKFNPIVVCPEQGALVDSLKEIGIETLIIPSKRFRHLSILFIIKLLRLFKEKDIAVVHTDADAQTFYAGIAAYLYGIPLVWHIRVSNGNSLIDRLLSYLCTKFILVAKALEERFYWLKSSNKLVTIHNGISLEEFDRYPRIDARKEFNIDKDSIIIGCIGRIEEIKGQEYLVKAISKVREIRKDIKALFVGEADKGYYELVRNLITQYKLDDFFIFTGYRNDTPGIIKDVDILVSPSLTEGLSRVLLEAMAAGKPVVTTDVGGAREVIIDGVNGFVVPSKNESAISSSIIKILSSMGKKMKMGNEGRVIVEKNFSIKNNIEKTEQLYLGMLNAD